MEDLQLQRELLPVRRKRNPFKIAIISFVVLMLLATIASVSIAAYVGLNLTHPDKRPINETPAKYDISYKDISFMSKDRHTKLSGWTLEPKEPAKMTLIFAHGYKGNRIERNIPFLKLAKDLLPQGFRIIMFDFRYAGKSGGNMTTVGAKEKLDLLGAIKFAKKEYKEPVGLYGISMGASTSLLAAAEDEDVVATVADSPFSDLRSYLEENMPVWTKLPDFPFTPLILSIIPLITELNPDEASPIKEISHISPRPVLFIHGNGDKYIPYQESEKMVKLDKQHFQLWVTDGPNHVESYKKYPKEYVARITDFYQQALEKTGNQ